MESYTHDIQVRCMHIYLMAGATTYQHHDGSACILLYTGSTQALGLNTITITAFYGNTVYSITTNPI